MESILSTYNHKHEDTRTIAHSVTIHMNQHEWVRYGAARLYAICDSLKLAFLFI